MQSLFVAAIVLMIIFIVLFFVFSSDVIMQKAPGVVNDFLSGLPAAIDKLTQRCGGYKNVEDCRNDAACDWCETEDENQNVFLFCTTKKLAAESKCSAPV